MAIPQETPHKCDICGNEILVDIGKAGRWDKVLHSGGPQQGPRPMGIQWSFYHCVMCGFEAPWNKAFIGSRELLMQYKELLDLCKTNFQKRTKTSEDLTQIKGLLDAQKTLSSLPGAGHSLEAGISQAVTPLLERIKNLETDFQRRKGGRPKKS